MAVDYNINKKVVKKDVSYLGRDFSSIRQNLIEFAKTYFPGQYNDFNESSPGMMFVEMAAYVGDVLNYYVDNQFRETLLNYAEEKKNVYNIAQSYGYKPKTAVPSTVEIEVSQRVPAKSDGSGGTEPDLDYAGVIERNGSLTSDTGVDFTLLDQVDFRVSSSLDPLEVEIIQPSSGTTAENYLLTKKVIAKSGETIEENITFSTGKKFDTITLNKTGVSEIISCVDSDGNSWYEVPFLAQDTVFQTTENTELNDPQLTQYQNDTPYMLRLVKSSKRFVTRINDDDTTELRFGAGVSDNPDEVIIPNPDNVGSALGFGVSKLDESFDPSNFMKTKTYGLAPANTTLTITYRYGGAVEHNVRANSITQAKNINFSIDSGNLVSDLVSDAEQSLSFNNPLPATGGASKETLTEIKQNALAFLNTQNRAVTRQDYITRVYSLPQKYGNISKWQINQPIVLSDIAYQISLVDGVASVVPPIDNNPNKELILIENKATTTSGYSGNVYDIEQATKKGVVYPSLDPSIFEVKYPNQDILGKVVGDI